MASIEKCLKEMGDPRSKPSETKFLFTIDFVNPDTNQKDKTCVEADMNDLNAPSFNDFVAGYWKGFVEFLGWDVSKVSVTSVWADCIY